MIPLVITTRPSGNSVVVGYQRPSLIFPWNIHSSVQGSNVKIVSRPIQFSPVFGRFPPTTSTRPSASSVWPPHQMLSPLGGSTRWLCSVAGSQTAAKASSSGP